MSSGVSGYEDYCGNRSLLECPYSVCDGCPIKERDKKYYAVWQLDAHPVSQVAHGWAEICYLKSKHTVVKFKGFGSSAYAKKYADDQ